MKKLIAGGVAAMVLAVGTVGAGCTAASRNAPAAMDYSALLSAIKAEGASVTEGDKVTQPFFSVQGRVVTVNGTDIQVYEYDTPASMEAESEGVSADGWTITTGNRSASVEWIASPHFYRAGRIMVIYIGDDRQTTHLLENVMGKQFAGSAE